jgi:hypothetical protein
MNLIILLNHKVFNKNILFSRVLNLEKISNLNLVSVIHNILIITEVSLKKIN